MNDIARLWRNAAPAQRVGMGAFALICLGLLTLVISLSRRPQYAVLYANLQPDDAAQVVQRLREMKTPYRVTRGGTVEVAADSIHELRLDLAAEGLPSGGESGFELLDRNRLGLTEFGERLNYQRALQGELTRTIAHLDPVERARVHIALPEKRLFSDQEERPTASVVLKLRGGRALSAAQVGSIVHLVSGAVDGLAPESVGVLDTAGKLLSSPDGPGGEGAGLAAASSHLQLRREYERGMEAAVQSMLDNALGPGVSVVRASADLTFDRVERERETYEPAGDQAGVLESRREFAESYRAAGQAAAAGVPGVSANTGAGASPALAPQGRGSSDQYQQTETTSQYLVSRERERTLRPPGQVRQVSLSVFLDKEADVGDLDELRAAVAAAAGVDPERGDAIVITRLPFQERRDEEPEGRAAAVKDFYFRVGRDFAAIVIAALFLRFLLALARREGERPEVVSRPGGREQEAPPAGVATSAAAGPPEVRSQPLPPPVDLDPERAAAVLRTWLSGDREVGGDGGAAHPAPAAE